MDVLRAYRKLDPQNPMRVTAGRLRKLLWSDHKEISALEALHATEENLHAQTGYRIDAALAASYAAPIAPPTMTQFCLADPLPHNPGLSPPEYDDLERAGSVSFPLPLLTAFRPVTFEQVGFPTRIHEVREILRYVDWNCEGIGPRLFTRGSIYPEVCFINAFTADEWALVDGLGKSVARMTEKRGGRAVRPVTALMNAISYLRIMSRLADFPGAPRSLTIFEVGPGKAYVGPMLASLGHRYRCFDVTQACYLWQHHMLRWAVGDQFEEMADKPPGTPIPDKAVVNLPWWRYASFLFEDTIQVDLVFSNSNLCEMTPDARRCVLQVSHRMLSESTLGVFFYIGPGAPAQSTARQLEEEIACAGFHRVTGTPFGAWTARPQPGPSVASLFSDGIPFFKPSGRGELFPADVVMRIPRNEVPLDIPYTKWKWGWDPPYLD